MQRLRTAAAAGLLLCMAAGASAAPSADAGYSSDSLYNQANAFARQGNAAMAVLFYERARVLAPRDPDIQANLAQVRANASLPASGTSWFERAARLANPNLMYWIGVAGLALALAGVLMRRFGAGRPSGWLGLALGIALAMIAAVDAAATWPLMHEAVVLHAATARVSPVSGSGTLFAIPAGQVVRLAEQYGEFALVRMPSGQSGWVALSDVVRVI
jgi:hypothetical protein